MFQIICFPSVFTRMMDSIAWGERIMFSFPLCLFRFNRMRSDFQQFSLIFLSVSLRELNILTIVDILDIGNSMIIFS